MRFGLSALHPVCGRHGLPSIMLHILVLLLEATDGVRGMRGLLLILPWRLHHVFLVPLRGKKKSSWPCLLAPRPNTRQFWPSLANTYGVPSLVQQPWQAIAVIELPKQHGIPSAPYLKPVMPRAPVELPRSRLTVDTTQCGIPASGEDL